MLVLVTHRGNGFPVTRCSKQFLADHHTGKRHSRQYGVVVLLDCDAV